MLCAFKFNKMPSKRELAMDWWNNLSWADKGNLMEGELKHRHPQSLTGREIEMLWLNCA